MALDRWMGGWMDGRAGLRIAYSNQKHALQCDRGGRAKKCSKLCEYINEQPLNLQNY